VLATEHFTFLGCHRPSDLKLPTFHSLHDGWLPAEDRQDEVAAGLEHFQLGRRRLLGAGMGAALDAAGQRVAAAVTLLVPLVVPGCGLLSRAEPRNDQASRPRGLSHQSYSFLFAHCARLNRSGWDPAVEG
jgi:hypothetical protein